MARRERRARQWPYVATAALLALIGYGTWLWFKVPYLIDPWRVMADLEAGTLPASMTGVMAAMLPLVVSALMLFAIVSVLLWILVFHHERRLIRLLRRLEAEAARDDVRGAASDRAAPGDRG